MRFVRWYYGSANLRKKLIISYGLLALLPVVLLGLYSYYFFGESFLEQAQFSMEDAASSMKIGCDVSFEIILFDKFDTMNWILRIFNLINEFKIINM